MHAEFYIERGLPGEAKQLLGEILLIAPDNEDALEMLKSAEKA